MILPRFNITDLGAVLAGKTPLGAFAPIDYADDGKSPVAPKAVADPAVSRHEKPAPLSLAD